MIEEGGTWRHELKYVCDVSQLKIIESRIRPLLEQDPHAGQSGGYAVRSVYFDDECDTCLKENEDGTDPREKFRIRIYNGNGARITLECKQKMRGMTKKLACPLNREQCETMLLGKPVEFTKEAPALLKKFLLQQKQRRLSARVIVEYDRIPYVCRLGNVRVTLDENIRSSAATEHFLDGSFVKRPVMPVGKHILEVKYDDFLPDPVRQVLALETLRRTSFSKYYLCRMYQ